MTQNLFNILKLRPFAWAISHPAHLLNHTISDLCHTTWQSLTLCFALAHPSTAEYTGESPTSQFFFQSPYLFLPFTSCSAIGHQLFIKANEQVRKDECLPKNINLVMGHRNNNAKIQLYSAVCQFVNQQLHTETTFTQCQKVTSTNHPID